MVDGPQKASYKSKPFMIKDVQVTCSKNKTLQSVCQLTAGLLWIEMFLFCWFLYHTHMYSYTLCAEKLEFLHQIQDIWLDFSLLFKLMELSIGYHLYLGLTTLFDTILSIKKSVCYIQSTKAIKWEDKYWCCMADIQ